MHDGTPDKPDNRTEEECHARLNHQLTRRMT